MGTVALALVAVLAGMAGSGPLADAVPRPPPLPATPLPVPTLDDWFTGGRADFRFKARLTAASMPGADFQFGNGAHLTPSPDDPATWYVFGRRVGRAQPDPPCEGMPIAYGIDVWKSSDGAASWSEPVTLAQPTEGTPWNCFAGDGDAYYDEGTRRWHYLAQCRGRDNLWNGCHWTSVGSDPMGAWHADPANPVLSVAAGSATNLWQRICLPATHCFRDSETTDPGAAAPRATVNDAGTFTIFDVAGDPGFRYVRFHGAASSNGHQFTGLAKTADFVNWVVGPDDPAHLPTDDIFDSRFPKGLPPGDGHGGSPAWQEPHWLPPNNSDAVIGGGGGDVVHEAPWYYLITEASDRPLCGMPGATWDLGVYRTTEVRNTVWDAPAHPHENPIAFSDESVAGSPLPSSCDPSYPRLVKDPATGETQLVYSRVVKMPGGPDAPPDPTRSGLYVHTLRWNLLDRAPPVADPAGGPSSPWRMIPAGADPPPPSPMAARRDTYRAPDGKGYLVFNCDGATASCGPSKAIFQDRLLGDDVSGSEGRSGPVSRSEGRSGPAARSEGRSGPGPRPMFSTFVFGGKAAALDGEGGSAQFLVAQLDASGRWLQTDAVTAEVGGPDYTSVISEPVALLPDTAWLRYMVWVNGERYTVAAGDLFIEPGS